MASLIIRIASCCSDFIWLIENWKISAEDFEQEEISLYNKFTLSGGRNFGWLFSSFALYF